MKLIMFGKKDNRRNSGWQLESLMPKYIPDQHEDYVAALEKAVMENDMRNIALSGHYGVGKSSILNEFAKRLGRKVVMISLSTLAPVADNQVSDSVPLQAMTPSNHIQREIVKQLLYREFPSKTKASQFKRIYSYKLVPDLASAFLFGFILCLTSLIMGWTSKVVEAIPNIEKLGLLAYPLYWLMFSVLFVGIRWIIHGQINIDKISAGSAKITLENSSVSYFDQYLDEIVYYFEISKCEVVIFEDLDRFDDSKIFEQLQALNTILNAAKQVRQCVHFVYAIKDSIFSFEQLDREGRLESSEGGLDGMVHPDIERTNRTKFFDLIIPVVPFVTYLSARDVAVRLLSEIEHNVDYQLLDLAVLHLPDMRMLKNVRNEFVVFRSRILQADGLKLGLSETDLYAMMLYKNVYISDFEKIRIRASVLNKLYERSRSFIVENLSRLDKEQASLKRKLSIGLELESQCKRLGSLLIRHVEQLSAALGCVDHDTLGEFVYMGKVVNDIRSPEFWVEFTKYAVGEDLHWRYSPTDEMIFSREYISDTLNQSLDFDGDRIVQRKKLERRSVEIDEQIKFLRGADFDGLIEHSEYSLCENNETLTFEDLARRLLQSELVFQLVRHGYINRNFMLYTSIFYGDRVSSTATNYLVHYVECDDIEPYYVLSVDDVDAVLRECAKLDVSEVAYYNLSIVDKLIFEDREPLEKVLRSLAKLHAREKRFIDAYLSSGAHPEILFSRLSFISGAVLTYVVRDSQIDGELKVKLLDNLLAAPQVYKLSVSSSVFEYIHSHVADFPVMHDYGTREQVGKIASMFQREKLILPHLDGLSDVARASFVVRGLYEINVDNLACAIGGNRSNVALDVIRKHNERVYRQVLGSLDAYFESVAGVSPVVCDPREFDSVLSDVQKTGSVYFNTLLSLSDENCQVRDLNVMLRRTWRVLARRSKFVPTFSNLYCYLGHRGIDADLARYLQGVDSIIDVESASDVQRAEFAHALINASSDLLDDRACLNLLSQLSLADVRLSTSDISSCSPGVRRWLRTQALL